MTREEFTERVGLNVSDGIFEVWNGVYMSSDKDKDEFCKPFATKKGHLDLSRSMVIEIAELKKKIRVQKESYDRQVELATSYQDKYYAEKAKHDEFYKKYAEECEKRYALERKLEQIMNLINAYPPYQSGRFDWHERGDPSENHQGPALVGGR